MKISPAAKNAAMIGSICAFSYLSVYIVRNILSAVSPQMIEQGVLTTENIGTMSSAYFTTYAFGQLINGMVGDKIKTKYMISVGLILAGLCCVAIPLFSADSATVAYMSYGAMGFFLSMIYGPMTKAVAENTDPRYTTRCSFAYTMATLVGSPLAGLLALILAWNTSFFVGSGLLVFMGSLFFIVFSVLEKKGIVVYGRYRRPRRGMEGLQELLRRRIVRFTFIAALTGITKTTVVAWLSTYFAQYLGFSSEQSALLFTICTSVISLTVFVSMAFYTLSRKNMDLVLFVSFLTAALCVLGAFFFEHPIVNIICIVLGVMGSNSAAVMLWSLYCPSLRDTGMVSSVTGFLDFISYMAGSLASTLSARAVGSLGWQWLVLIWFGLMIFGAVISLPIGKRNRESKTEEI
ncbi:MAG: MFS transporter [Clostridia bacterium]|nr:MFS transporter [Clostridia bacterium]